MGSWIRPGSYKTSNCILYRRKHMAIIIAMEEYGNDSEFIRNALEQYVDNKVTQNGIKKYQPDSTESLQKDDIPTKIKHQSSSDLEEMKDAMSGI